MGGYEVFYYLADEPCKGGSESLVRSKWEAPGGRSWLQACQAGVAEGRWPGEQECLWGLPCLAREWGQAAF